MPNFSTNTFSPYRYNCTASPQTATNSSFFFLTNHLTTKQIAKAKRRKRQSAGNRCATASECDHATPRVEHLERHFGKPELKCNRTVRLSPNDWSCWSDRTELIRTLRTGPGIEERRRRRPHQSVPLAKPAAAGVIRYQSRFEYLRSTCRIVTVVVGIRLFGGIW